MNMIVTGKGASFAVPNLAAALLDAKDDEALTGLNLQVNGTLVLVVPPSGNIHFELSSSLLAICAFQPAGAVMLCRVRVRLMPMQGFLVGNAWTDPKIDNNGTVDFWWDLTKALFVPPSLFAWSVVSTARL